MARTLLILVGATILVGVVGKSVVLNVFKSDVSEYVEQLEKRPYVERDLADEYGIRLDPLPRHSGPLSHMAVATRANKVGNCLEAEASRIQIEFEDKAGILGALLTSVNASRIARQRFEDQGLLPKKGD